jgi:hypothetical protein
VGSGMRTLYALLALIFFTLPAHAANFGDEVADCAAKYGLPLNSPDLPKVFSKCEKEISDNHTSKQLNNEPIKISNSVFECAAKRNLDPGSEEFAYALGECYKQENNKNNEDDDFNQLKSALALHLCVKNETKLLLSTIQKNKYTSSEKIEPVVWNKILGKCSFIVTTNKKVIDLIHHHYSGNEQRMIDFRDGLLWSERAYVFYEVEDWMKQERK